MKMLNLYSGLGGNRKNLPGNVEVTAVEQSEDIAEVYSRLYPQDELIVGDAHNYLEKHFSEYDFIWSSPPCQSHSKMIISGKNRTPRFPDFKLYEEITFLQQFFNGLWVVENVKPYYDPLIPAQSIGRHLFWCNFQLKPMEEEPKIKSFIDIDKKKLMDFLGIHYEGNIYYDNNHDPCQVLRNCVHPDMGRHVFDCAIGNKVNTNSQQITMEI